MAEKQLKIMLMGSDAQFRGKLDKQLSGRGYEVETANSAGKGLHALEHTPVNIVIFDTERSETDIGSIVASIRSQYPETAVVLLGANGDDAVSMIQAGADDYLLKSAEYDRLPFALSVIHERHTFNYELQTQNEDLQRQNQSLTLDLENTRKMFDDSFVDTIKAFIGLLETRDHFLGSHSKRVATFSRAVSERYDLTDRIRHEIEIGALLHDIGKMGLSDTLLARTRNYFMVSQLTRKEEVEYRKHPVIGQEALEMIDTTRHLGSYVYHHHERFDGQGYPDGLDGYLIPLGSRIISVIDAYDRIVFGAEKQKQKEAQVLFVKFLQKNKGVLFDPETCMYVIDFIKKLKSEEYSSEKRIPVDDLEPGMILSRDIFTMSGVLVRSQYERLTASDISRLQQFNTSKMIIGSVYVYESGNTVQSPSKEKNSASITSMQEIEELTFESVRKSVESVRDFKTLKSVRDHIFSVIDDPKSTRDDITEIIKMDPVISLKTLRIVNSPLFGFARDVSAVDDAIPVLGLREIRNIVTSIEICQEPPDDTFNRHDFWVHCLGVAAITEIIGGTHNTRHPELYFCAGLFHDIGKLVLDQLFPEKYRQVLQLVSEKSIFYRKAERKLFGKPHQEIADFMLGKWNVPAIVRDAVLHHHSPVDNSIDPRLVSSVHLADIIAHMLDIGDSGEKSLPKYESYAERQLGITLAEIESLVPAIDESLQEKRRHIGL